QERKASRIPRLLAKVAGGCRVTGKRVERTKRSLTKALVRLSGPAAGRFEQSFPDGFDSHPPLRITLVCGAMRLDPEGRGSSDLRSCGISAPPVTIHGELTTNPRPRDVRGVSGHRGGHLL